MKRQVLAALLLIATGLSAAPRPTPPKTGHPAPTFTLRDHLGKRVSLAAGKTAVLVFYRGYW